MLYDLALGDFRPDLTLILNIPVETGMERIRSRAGNPDRYEQMDIEFHNRLRDGFLQIARKEPDRCAVIDAAADIDTVTARIRDYVSARLGVKLTA